MIKVLVASSFTVLSLIAATTLSPTVIAQTYPVRPIKLITAGAPGSVTDVVARPMAEKLTAELNQSVIVENHSGAGGIAAIDLVAKAKPDGYTLGVATISQLVLNQYLFSKLPYDPLRDFEPIVKMTSGSMVVAAHASFRGNSLTDLVALARAQPGRIQYAIPQLGSPPHIVALMLSRAAGIDMTVVPFRSALDALTSVLNGDVPLLFDAPPIVAEHVKAGRLKALAVTGSRRSSLLPGTPTFAESGFPNLRVDAWIGLVAPARTPPAVVQQINAAAMRALHSSDLKRYYESADRHVIGGSAEEFAASIRDDHAVWGKAIAEGGLRLE